jgi:hypothetical protein
MALAQARRTERDSTQTPEPDMQTKARYLGGHRQRGEHMRSPSVGLDIRLEDMETKADTRQRSRAL